MLKLLILVMLLGMLVLFFDFADHFYQYFC